MVLAAGGAPGSYVKGSVAVVTPISAGDELTMVAVLPVPLTGSPSMITGSAG